MSCAICSSSTACNVLSYKAALSRADLQVKYPYLPPPSFLQENFCLESSVLRCQGWDGAVCGQVMAWPCTIASSIRWNLFIVAYDLLQKSSHLGKRKIKEEGGKKKVPLISLLFPLLFPNQNFETLQGLIIFFSPCFSIMKSSDSFFS